MNRTTNKYVFDPQTIPYPATPPTEEVVARLDAFLAHPNSGDEQYLRVICGNALRRCARLVASEEQRPAVAATRARLDAAHEEILAVQVIVGRCAHVGLELVYLDLRVETLLDRVRALLAAAP